MIRAEITNFESIDHAVIEIDGFTSVQGPNYSGKSAAMRAINAALTNLSGTEFISWGKTFCEVSIQAEGLALLWHKEEGNNFYVINDTKYSKTGRDEPPDELADLGYGTVRVNGVRHNLHYADQFNPLFLVNQQNTKNSDLIASAYGLDRLYKASELCSKDQKSADTLLKIRKKDLDNVTKDLNKFEDLDDIIEAGSKLKRMVSDISSSESSIEKVKKWLITVAQTVTDCNRLKPVTTTIIPDSESLSLANTEHHNALGLFNRLESDSSEVRRYSPIDACIIPDAEDLASFVGNHKILTSLNTKYESVQLEADKLSSYDSIDISSEDVASNIGSGIESLLMLKKAVADIISLKNDSESLLSERNTCSSDLEIVEKERATFEACPLCGGKL